MFIDKAFLVWDKSVPIFQLWSYYLLRRSSKTPIRTFSKMSLGYRWEFIDAISANMSNNRLWENDKYTGASWPKEGAIDNRQFGMQVDAAMGCLWFSEEPSKRPTVDVLKIEPGPRGARAYN